MALKHAILGLLNIQSMNGYQIKKYLDISVKHFWGVSISQIYPTLSSMLESDLINMEDMTATSSRVTKIYSITSKGKKELIDWLEVPAKEESLRSEMLLKLYFSSQVSPQILLEKFNQQKSNAQERLAFYQAGIEHLQKNHSKEQALKKDAVFWEMTARYGIYKDEAIIAWCDECMQTIAKRYNLLADDLK